MDLSLAASITGLMFTALLAFVIAFRNARWTLFILVPLILSIGSLGVFSYKSLLGYPTQLEWSEMPDPWTAIFFRAKDKKTMTIWLLEEQATRLVQLPYDKRAMDALQKERSIMGQGIPATFSGRGKIESYGDPIKGRLPRK